MEENLYGFMTEEGRRFHEEIKHCQTEEERDAVEKRWELLNESQGPFEIPHLDMTLEEFCQKYNCTRLNDIMNKYGF